MGYTKEQSIAKQIAAALLTNGNNETGDRLVIELPGKRDGGGWCRSAIENQVLDVLAGQPTE